MKSTFDSEIKIKLFHSPKTYECMCDRVSIFLYFAHTIGILKKMPTN